MADTGNITPSALRLSRENFGGAAVESQLSSGSREVDGPVVWPRYTACRFGWMVPGAVEGRRAADGEFGEGSERREDKDAVEGEDGLKCGEEGRAQTGISGTGGGGVEVRGSGSFFEERVEADRVGRAGSGASFTNPQESLRDRFTGSGLSGSVGLGASVWGIGGGVTISGSSSGGRSYREVGRLKAMVTSGLELILLGLYFGLSSLLAEDADSSLPFKVPSWPMDGPASGEDRRGRPSRRGEVAR